ncbi:hypothetical protein [Heyndrickxia oleronia]|uniref:hypothetical protein n=1 Tax=Heyndrickxia oleronia TaxID=38875 RepID=UPI001C0E9B39|nr:hypothetical protein [Heyndrickxia oleronia]MBU5215087.1 hypothetical protein [Heyndrickxia oleronia]
MEPLKNMEEENLYNITLLAEQKLAEGSLILAKLKIPPSLPDEIKTSLENVKVELLIGFRELEKSMNYLAKYIMYRNPFLYDKFIEKRDMGFLYIDGGLKSLTTVRLRLHAPERTIPDAWKVSKGRIYQIEKKTF